MKLTDLTKKLISFNTITPQDNGIMAYLEGVLKKIGFEYILIKNITDVNENAEDTLNIYASLYKETTGRNLTFAGHVDVVPPGKEFLWKYPPFEPTIEDGVLYGRGASDMKSAISAFIIAVQEALTEGFKPNGNISLLLTGDEEANAINGTEKMLIEIKKLGINLDKVIVGEPTSEEKLGDTIKIGRRGSISFNLEVEGVQGHIAYPDLAKNPIPELAKLIFILSGLKLDNGNENFSPSSLQVVKLEAENTAENVIPKTANCFFNIRFNNTYTGQVLAKKIKEIITQNTSFKFKLSYKISGEAFLTAKAEFAEVVARSVEENTGLKPNFSTSGGTSDARFIKNYAKEVLELGVLNQTAHKIDECINIKDIDILKNIYKTVIINYLK